MENSAALSLRLRGDLGFRFFVRSSKKLEKLLRNSRTTITLTVEEFYGDQKHNLDCFLNRLARYGDRISIRVNKSLMPLLQIDSSRFHLVLDDKSR
jgi:hypothetical protein